MGSIQMIYPGEHSPSTILPCLISAGGKVIYPQLNGMLHMELV